MSKKRALRLFVVLAIAALLLAGCAVTYDAEGNPQIPTWIAPIAVPLRFGVTFLYDKVLTPLGIPSYGLAIILLTVIIRLLLYPLTKKQMESMKKMQSVQPKMKELQEKYGKDREKLAQKQMELYKEEGVNPAGGCLPLLVQMPILFAFYYALISLGSLLNQPFLWIPSLAFPAYNQGMTWLTPVTIQHLLSPEVWPYLILPIIYILSQLVMQRMSQASTPTAGGGSTNTVMMLMPLMFGYITLVVPSGLTLYWVTSNVFQIIQQGLTTGWTGLLPGKREPAPAVKPTAARAAVAASSKQETVVTGSAGAGAKKEGAAAPSASQTPPMTAGRRRKLRKKR